MEIYEILTLLGIVCISLLLSGYIGYWYLKKSHYLEETIQDIAFSIIEEAQTNEIIQKQIYTIGALLGTGIANGSGLNKSLKGGGKLSLNNIIAEIASNWIQQRSVDPSPLQPTPSQSHSTQTLTDRKVSDKW